MGWREYMHDQVFKNVHHMRNKNSSSISTAKSKLKPFKIRKNTHQFPFESYYVKVNLVNEGLYKNPTND
jgi:hypothetical protein